MKVFSSKNREIPKTRTKYGKPENKKEALERLKKEKELKREKEELIKEVKEKNKNEFYFSFYSMNKNMIKKTKLEKAELLKTLKYIDSEIVRCERIISKNKGIEQENTTEYEEYVAELKIKRRELFNKIKNKS